MPPLLTGHWVGHYTQRDQARGIAADLVQTGNQLRGTMRDQQTRIESSVFDAAVEVGLPPGADEQIVAALHTQFPDEGKAPVRAVSCLPEDSLIEGTVRGQAVSFTKSYQGDTFSGFQVGSQRVGTSAPGHRVHYEGRLSEEGDVLSGHWWIEANPERGTRRSEGTFVLRREG